MIYCQCLIDRVRRKVSHRQNCGAQFEYAGLADADFKLEIGNGSWLLLGGIKSLIRCFAA